MKKFNKAYKAKWLYIKLVSRLVNILGFYPERLRKPNEMYENLRNKPIAVQEHEVDKLTFFLRRVSRQKYYNSLLKAFIPNWNPKIKNTKFVGTGVGKGSLNTHRKVDINGATFLEKVYFTSHSDWEGTKLFYENIYTELKDVLKIPKLEKVYKTDALTLVYFEFFELNHIMKPSEQLNYEIELTNILYDLTLTLTLPQIHKAAKGLKTGSEKKQKLIAEEGIEVNNLIESLKHSRKVFAHGDIHKQNVYQDSMVIDWDGCGMYPIGFEPAKLFYKYHIKHENMETDVSTWIEEHYQPVIQKNDWKDFKGNFAYYVLIRSIKKFNNSKFKNMKNQLITIANGSLN